MVLSIDLGCRWSKCHFNRILFKIKIYFRFGDNKKPNSLLNTWKHWRIRTQCTIFMSVTSNVLARSILERSSVLFMSSHILTKISFAPSKENFSFIAHVKIMFYWTCRLHVMTNMEAYISFIWLRRKYCIVSMHVWATGNSYKREKESLITNKNRNETIFLRSVASLFIMISLRIVCRLVAWYSRNALIMRTGETYTRVTYLHKIVIVNSSGVFPLFFLRSTRYILKKICYLHYVTHYKYSRNLKNKK